MGKEKQLAQALGWFSIGLGLTELLAPRYLAEAIGVPSNRSRDRLLRFLGLREIASGVGILAGSRQVGAVGSRVAGDVMDLALLDKALGSKDSQPGKVAMATAAVLGVTIADIYCYEQLKRSEERSAGALKKDKHTVSQEVQDMNLVQAITIDRPASELYTYWHDFQNLPRFMNHLEAVQVTGPTQSHWKAKAPAGQSVEWDAEVVEDRPNEFIAWRSLEGADVANAGSVQFQPAAGGRGTVVRVAMKYDPPGGTIGAAIAKLFGEEPKQQIWEDLHRLKQVMETGEVVRSDGALEGMGSSQRPGQPAPR